MATATVKSLKIKTGTCRRIFKELRSYEKEVERESAKTNSMRENGADPHDLKQQENVLVESRMMVPDCRKRLEAALLDLESLLVEAEEDGIDLQITEVQTAREVVTEVKPLFTPA